MHQIKYWIEAFRLRTLPLALSSITLGGFLAAAEGKFDWRIFLLAGLTTLFLQVLSNLSNDYGDTVHGADHGAREGPSRAVQSGAISKDRMRNAIIVFTMLSLASGYELLKLSLGTASPAFWIFLLLGMLAIWAAVKYTAGKNPYGYAGFGDLSVLLFFGILGVSGSYYLFTGTFRFMILLPSLSMGLLATAVLNINNIRDIASDKLAGKKSIPVRIGRRNAVRYHWALLITAFLCALVFTVINYHTPFQFLFLLVLPFIINNGLRLNRSDNAGETDPLLRQMALITLLFVITFGIGLLIS